MEKTSAAPTDWGWTELPAAGRASDLTACCAELQVTAHASREQIHSAYRALLLQYHPDRARPADRDPAEERTKRITHAYRTLIEQAP